MEDEAHVLAHRETKSRGRYEGKTYDSAQSIADFFKNRATRLGQPQSRPNISPAARKVEQNQQGQSPASDALPGSYVRHAKYGRGLVLRREGSGDQIKLTVSFPGYGQKKLVEKYAGLEKA